MAEEAKVDLFPVDVGMATDVPSVTKKKYKEKRLIKFIDSFLQFFTQFIPIDGHCQILSLFGSPIWGYRGGGTKCTTNP